MTFPDDQARILIIYALALAAIAFNLSRYSATFLRWRIYASPITVLIIDSILIGLLIALVGDINTPYSAFLVF